MFLLHYTDYYYYYYYYYYHHHHHHHHHHHSLIAFMQDIYNYIPTKHVCGAV
jgi:hypothetical protein